MLQYFFVIDRLKGKIKDICLFEVLKAFLIGNFYNILQYFFVIERLKDIIKDICLFEVLKAFLIGSYYVTILFC